MGKYTVQPRNKKGTRTGFTTGTNAAAAAKASVIALLTRQWPEFVSVTLPIGEVTQMYPVETELTANYATCCMVKDAGDDPDVTHGALICARVERVSSPGITLEGGLGVGRVTLPGLGLEVGGPAINPVPRQQISANITDAVCTIHPNGEDWLETQGLLITISVPKGEELAKRTLNARLGILGGISILGTTGKVFPYSTAAWRASVIQAVEVAAQNTTDRIVLATGGRSERFAMGILPELPDVAFVECSVFTGAALKTCIDYGITDVVFVGMIGKMTKTGQGHMQTHVAGNQVDFEFLARICEETQAPEELVNVVRSANTARHFLELCQEHRFMPPIQRVTEYALESCNRFIEENGGKANMETILVDFDGTVLARAASQARDLLAPDGRRTGRKPLTQRLAENPDEFADHPGDV